MSDAINTATTDYGNLEYLFIDPVGYYWYNTWSFNNIWNNLYNNIIWPYRWMQQTIVFLPYWVTFGLFWVIFPFTLINAAIMLGDGVPLWSFLWKEGDTSFIDFWIDI